MAALTRNLVSLSSVIVKSREEKSSPKRVKLLRVQFEKFLRANIDL